VRNLQVKEASQLGIDLAGGFQRFRVIPVMDRGKLAIKLTTTDPVNEPFLNVLIELKWPTGTVYREYALLMDLKMVARSTEPSAPLADASARPSTNSTLSTELPGSEDYRVRSGDSLSKIAGRIVADTDTRRTDMMQWLLDNNPRAFVNNDPNRLLAGANLVLPASQQYPLPTAVQRPARPQPQMAAAEPELSPNRVPAAEVVDQATTKKLTIVTANISQESIMNGEPISDGNVNAMRNRLQVTNEEIDRLSRENQVMQQRLKDIEQADYVTSLERLLALKDQESKSLAEQLKQTQQDAARMTAENADLTQQVSSNSGESIGGWRFWILLLLLLLSIAGAVKPI
jgi:Tfp pilus assembly protein FimV